MFKIEYKNLFFNQIKMDYITVQIRTNKIFISKILWKIKTISKSNIQSSLAKLRTLGSQQKSVIKQENVIMKLTCLIKEFE